MATLLSVMIPVFCGVSVFFFALSLLPTKSALTQQLEDLKARDPRRRDHARTRW